MTVKIFVTVINPSMESSRDKMYNFIVRSLAKSVSYQKKDRWGLGHQSFFWYDNGKDLFFFFFKDLNVSLSVFQLTWEEWVLQQTLIGG